MMALVRPKLRVMASVTCAFICVTHRVCVRGACHVHVSGACHVHVSGHAHVRVSGVRVNQARM